MTFTHTFCVLAVLAAAASRIAANSQVNTPPDSENGQDDTIITLYPEVARYFLGDDVYAKYFAGDTSSVRFLATAHAQVADTLNARVTAAIQDLEFAIKTAKTLGQDKYATTLWLMLRNATDGQYAEEIAQKVGLIESQVGSGVMADVFRKARLYTNDYVRDKGRDWDSTSPEWALVYPRFLKRAILEALLDAGEVLKKKVTVVERFSDVAESAQERVVISDL